MPKGLEFLPWLPFMIDCKLYDEVNSLYLTILPQVALVMMFITAVETKLRHHVSQAGLELLILLRADLTCVYHHIWLLVSLIMLLVTLVTCFQVM